jgi:hypothetical protein
VALVTAKIGADANNRIIYTTDQRVGQLKAGSFRIPFTRPATTPEIDKSLVPLLKVFSDANLKGEIVEGFPGGNSVLLPISNILATASVTSHGLIRDYQARLLPGLRMNHEKVQAGDFKGVEVLFTLRLLGEINGTLVEIYLDQIQPDKGSQSPWIASKNIIERGQGSFGIKLYNAALIGNLKSLIRGSGSIGLYAGASPSEEGVFILNLPSASGQGGAARLIASSLGAETVFRGKKSSFYGNGKSGDYLGNLTKILNAGKTIYVLRRGKTYPVSKDFVKTHAEVAAFIDKQARAIFLENVDIIYSL